MRNFLWIGFVAAVLISCNHHPVADRIYLNAKIWTGDSANPEAKAIAIRDSIILYVGDDYQSYTGNNTILTDLQGKMIVPGFIDNHVHFLGGGYYLANINLRNVKSKEDFIKVFSLYTDSAKGTEWIDPARTMRPGEDSFPKKNG
jgi:predicted amidohydrolase YtcJ